MILSLKWKIVFTMGLLAAVCTILSGSLSTWLLIKNHDRFLEQQLNSTATTLMSLGITDYSGLQGFQKLDAFVREALHIEKVEPIVHVFTKRGKLMFSSLPETEEDFKTAFEAIQKPRFSIYEGKRQKYKLLTTAYKSKKGRDYVLQIAMPYPLYRDIVAESFREAALLFSVLSLLAFAISHILARKIIRPVRDIAVYLNGLNPTEIKNWQTLLLSKPGDYLRDIASGVNSLTTRIKSAMYNMSRSSRYLAHELRNPLTVMIGEAEAILAKPNASPSEYRCVIQSSLEEVARIDTVVSTVLKLFKKEKSLYNPSSSDLSRWLDEQVVRWKKYLERPIAWDRPNNPIVALVDSDLLYRLLDNLIRNVKIHTPAVAELRILLQREGPSIFITIDDAGPGLPPSVLNVLGKKEGGDEPGIGLALCLEIASICNFKLRFENKNSGGLRVTIALE